MRLTRRRTILGAIGSFLAGCAGKVPQYDGPEVTRIQVFKEARVMQLLSGNQQLAAYEFDLGFAPKGHKQFEGDGRTPEGAYRINRRNPNSRFHLSLGISYPNAADRAYARAQGKSPGGDIFFHGTPDFFRGRDDWTWGCIAISNEQIEQMYAMVKDGTPVFIYP